MCGEKIGKFNTRMNFMEINWLLIKYVDKTEKIIRKQKSFIKKVNIYENTALWQLKLFTNQQ